MKILVTGSNGTIGTRLCETLLKGNHLVSGVDSAKQRYHAEVGDLTHRIDLRHEFDQFRSSLSQYMPDVVVHLANHARVAKLVEEPQLALENMVINFNTLEACRLAGVKKVIFGSSREVYGNSPKGAGGRSEVPVYIDDCISPYSASKMSGEALCHAYAECYNMSFTILRFSNVYGMYDFSDRVIPRWLNCLEQETPMELHGCEKTLDFTYIDDTVSGIIGVIQSFNKPLEKPSPNAKGHVRTFNVASGTETRLLDVAIKLGELLGKEPTLKIKKNNVGEVVHYRADISSLQIAVNYTPMVDIDLGLEKAVAWYKEVGYVG